MVEEEIRPIVLISVLLANPHDLGEKCEKRVSFLRQNVLKFLKFSNFF